MLFGIRVRGRCVDIESASAPTDTEMRTTEKPMNRSNLFLNALLIAVLVALLAPASQAGKPDGKGGGNGGGGGGGEEDPPAAVPVEYELHMLGDGTAHAMNEFGVVVGRNVWDGGGIVIPGSLNGVRAMRYTPTANGPVVEDLNEVPNVSWEDLDQPGVAASDWIAVSASDINLFGQIVGVAENTRTLETGVFFFEPGSSPKFTVMPGTGPDPRSYQVGDTIHINNTGVIAAKNPNSLVIYSPAPSSPSFNIEVVNVSVSRLRGLNDDGWLIGWNDLGGVQIEPDENGHYSAMVNLHPIVEGCRLWGINNASPASICGTKTDGNNWKSNGPFKMVAGGTFADAEWFYPTNVGSAKDINDDGDVVQSGGPSYLYYEGQSAGTGTHFVLDDLIAPEDSTFWAMYQMRHPTALTNRDSVAGFPSICYVLRTDYQSHDGVVALLIPRVPQP